MYNGENFLEESLKCNLAQSYDNFELIISDNASTDETEAICRDYAASDERIRYVRNNVNIGAAQNYNELFRLSRGDYFRWSNADDLVDPALIERTLPILKERGDVAIAFGITNLIDAGGKIIDEYEDKIEIEDDRPSSRYKEFYQRNGLTNAIYGLMSSSAMQGTSLMGNGKLPAGDISFLAAMSIQGKFVRIPEVLFYRRIHDAAFSSNPDPEAEAQFWKASPNQVKMHNWRAFSADGRAILKSKASLAEKLRMLNYCGRRMVWQRRLLMGDIRNLFASGSG